MNVPQDNSRKQLVHKVAWLHYEGGYTQADIADQLGLSRPTVNRMIKEAHELGVVEIKVHAEDSERFELGQQLCRRFDLLDAVCTPMGHGQDELLLHLAAAAADVLQQRLKDGMTVAIGIGRTVSRIPDHFPAKTIPDCRIISLTGGLDLHQSGVPHPFNTLSRLAEKLDADVMYIPTPSYVGDPAAKAVLLEEPSVTTALGIAAAADIAIFSIGAADHTSLLFQFNYINADDMRDLKEQHAAGDVIGRFFDTEGQPLAIDLNQRIIGLSLDDLRAIPVNILAAGGENKREALHAALKSQLCSVLITDTDTARWLLAA